MTAKTLFGLEEILADELKTLGANDIVIGRRMVGFTGDKALLYSANIKLRTALRILKPIVTFKAKTPDDIYERLVKYDWSEILSSDQTFAIDAVIYSEDFTHSQYVSYKTKDAIADYFREREGKRPSVRLKNPDVMLNIHISHNDVTVSLDSSGDSLHKRGYRIAQTDAPLNEVLAAGIILKTGWRGETDLIDPMCGSGTFLIEAALIARNIAPGIYRSGYAFEKWPDFDQELFQSIYQDDSDEKIFEHHIYGSDILPEAISKARANVSRAGLDRDISLEVSPMQRLEAPAQKALVVMNPPYGERIRMQDASDLYGMIGERLKHIFTGCSAWVLAYKPEHFNSIGLKPSSKTTLMNGGLECELRSYELFDGSRKDFKENPHKMFVSKGNDERPARRFERSDDRGSFRRERKFDKSTSSDDRRRGGFKKEDRFGAKSERRERPERRFDKNKPFGAKSRGDNEKRFSDRGKPSRPDFKGNDSAKKEWPTDRFKKDWPTDRFKKEGDDNEYDGTRKRRTPQIQVFKNIDDNKDQ
ncbi:THUMP domain-containing class I SAM-dependent RNA methyltransferase [Porphyromonas pogonae]|uniref:THUMP domain-containing class I SAM-dependent RNA methyltransferase n=1 Tax=Porphyromonas pogonae TaxID=867595 RepID=UPI002E7916BB|nr:THUMP domain-containing protein [Porphyromonas pogonae]